jgi:sRNA-binding carbon storage regulator CsrA
VSNRVVVELKVGESVSVGGIVTVKVQEKTGRTKARLVFELPKGVKLHRDSAKPEKAAETG